MSTTQLRGALQATAGFAELRELDQFPRHAVHALRSLIKCDHAGYNVIDLESGRATVIAEPEEVVFDGGPEALGRLGHQNPIIVRARSGETGPLVLSDYISQRELHRTELYNEIYRVVGLEYQLAVKLPAPRRVLGRPTEIVGISLARSRSDFSRADRLLLELLAPHFAATLERLHERALLNAILATARAGASAHVVLIDQSDLTVAWVDDRGGARLGLEVGSRAPETLRRWLLGFCGSDRIALGGQWYSARRVQGAYPGLVAVHLRSEAASDPDRLRALGLTPRQAEVHALAMQGRASKQIASELALSPRTVEKHIEGIYARLGVTTRAEAILATVAALERLG